MAIVVGGERRQSSAKKSIDIPCLSVYHTGELSLSTIALSNSGREWTLAMALCLSKSKSARPARHAEVYATSATDEDPASRLAFRVRYQDSAGLDRHFYAKDSNVTPVFRANTFVDILINDVPNETIAQTPRRWLYLKKGRSIAGLEKFEGGGYTSPTA
ncbi:hypothetical protein N8T08_008139 [Aspergillus melleus]|uniref:Uncharacterized protein n=1 Tax=Aspergillus melleus TaxID=138277 RepID=A0ACC3AWB1_9EURO|nr:hypothetical protein N8T08_008139 [Aspergillus melleus]